MFDYGKLRGRIVEKFRTQSRFSKAMGVSERTISLKMTGKVFFSQDEILKAVSLLELHEDEIPTYFFQKKVQENELADPETA